MCINIYPFFSAPRSPDSTAEAGSRTNLTYASIDPFFVGPNCAQTDRRGLFAFEFFSTLGVLLWPALVCARQPQLQSQWSLEKGHVWCTPYSVRVALQPDQLTLSPGRSANHPPGCDVAQRRQLLVSSPLFGRRSVKVFLFCMGSLGRR